jgi:hypothetical protein
MRRGAMSLVGERRLRVSKGHAFARVVQAEQKLWESAQDDMGRAGVAVNVQVSLSEFGQSG